MSGEQPARLDSIRGELLAIRSSEFWEISDRGANFDYLPPKRKRRMLEFFGWFGDRLAPLPEPAHEALLDEPPPHASSVTGGDRDRPRDSALPEGLGLETHRRDRETPPN
jgi:hypothetical protein